ncbi:MAG: carbohydrate binding domain-containing protein [Bacteroidales bacterium]|nr:carbohydrate binding domain-containing protein [Bacteroidales bacterium]
MDFVTYNTGNVTYGTGEIEGADYEWSVPGGAEIISGQGSPKITVNWGLFGGNVEVRIVTTGGTYLKTLPVRVSSNLLKNRGFEKGVKYWKSSTGYPVRAQMNLREGESHGGTHSIHTTITVAGGNPWDVQLSHRDLDLKGGTTYNAGFMAKSGVPGNKINAAIINQSNFALAAQKQISPLEDWGLYEFDFTPSQNITAAFNVDMGGNTGSYYLDDFVLTTEELTNLNLVKNPDFFDGMEGWTLTTLSSAIADGSAVQGEYTVSIGNGGGNPWDVFLGQSGLLVEQGFEYTISFDAYAGAPRRITPLVGKNSEPWTVYSGGEPVSISTTRQTYSFTFPMNEPTDPDSRLGFDTGGDEGVVYFDNILLRKGGQLSTSANIFNVSPGLNASLRIYPNPVHNLTSFYYTLQKPAQVTLRIFNLNGQEVETLENGFRLQGEHIIRWNAGKHPAGVYFCRLKVDGWSEILKLILL